MKRFIALLLLATMLFSLVSCSQKTGVKKTEEKEEVPLTQMDAESFYSYATEKNKSLISARYETKVSSEEEDFVIDSVRIRSGYDSFTYSRKGKDYIAFDGEKAFVENETGKFASPATVREFEEYLSEYSYPLYGLDGESLEKFSRDGNKVFYESKNAELLSRYSALFAQKGFLPSELKGEAEMNEEGIIVSEKIALSDGEKAFTLETKLEEYRSDAIRILLPEEEESFLVLQDIRIPQEFLSAKDALFALDEFHLVLVSAESVSCGEKKYALNEDKNIYQVKKEEGASSYYSRQSLKQLPEVPEESLFYQALTDGGVQTENLYNVILGEKLSENTVQGMGYDFVPEVEKILLSFSDLKGVTKEKGSESTSFRFELNETASQRVLGLLLSHLTESGVLPEHCSINECLGTLSIENQTGALVGISYTVSGSVSKEGEAGSFSVRYSLQRNPKEKVQLPALQIPTPTTPGM